jgi:hypothetical protein
MQMIWKAAASSRILPLNRLKLEYHSSPSSISETR